MKAFIINLFLVILFFGFISCDRPQCKNDNPIFENNTPDSKVYKDELAKRLEIIDQTKLTYWLRNYYEKDGRESLFFYIQSDELCSILHLTVNDWNKLERVRDNKGVGRSNAEFTNLKFEIRKDSVKTEFIYKTFDRIID